MFHQPRLVGEWFAGTDAAVDVTTVPSVWSFEFQTLLGQPSRAMPKALRALQVQKLGFQTAMLLCGAENRNSGLENV